MSCEISSRHMATKDFITRSEFSKRKAIWKSSSSNTDTFEDAVATKLVKNQRCVELFRSFLVIWKDAAHEVRMRLGQLSHETGQLLRVPLCDSTEETLLDSASWAANVINFLSAIREQAGDVLVGRSS